MMNFQGNKKSRHGLFAFFWILALLLATNVSLLFAGFNGIQRFISYKQKGNEINLVCKSETGQQIPLRITVCSPEIIHIIMSPTGKMEQSALVKYGIVNNNWPQTNFSLENKKNFLILKTDKLIVKIKKYPFRIIFLNKNQKMITEESKSGIGYDSRTGEVIERFHLFKDEHFFGTNARFGPPLDMRGDSIFVKIGREKHKSQNRIDIPFFMSTKGYGIFFNTTWPQTYEFGSEHSNYYSLTAEGGNVDYYFIYGPSFKNILDLYTDITGKSPLPPKWAFGVWVNTYSEQKDVLRVCRTFREEKIPADVLVIDSSWMSKNPEKRHTTLGNGESMGYDALQWDRFRYPHPEKMISEIHRMGYKFGLWNEFHVNKECKELFEYASKHNYLIKNKDGTINLGHRHHSGKGLAAEIDFSNPAAAKWWWNRPESKALFKMGLDVFKQDHTTFRGKNVVFYNGMSQEEMHNLYPLLYIQSGFNETKKLVKPKNRRGLIFTACGYAGIQRYPINWCDDIRLSQFKSAITYVENLGLSGVAFTYGLQANLKGVRAAEFGMFCPIAEDFQGAPRFKGDLILKLKKENKLKPYRFYHQLHYALMPYIYTYAHIAHETGLPIVRALVLEYQNDPNVYNKDLEYLFGKELLVAPIIEEEKATRNIYLPKGKWIDYWNGKSYDGPTNISYTAPLDQIPLFVRAGAIIPLQPKMEYTGQKAVDPLTLDIYPFKKSKFTLYEDDGETEAYRTGSFALTSFGCDQEKSMIVVKIGKSKGEYEGKLTKRSYILKLHGLSLPGKIVEGKKIIKQYNSMKKYEQKANAWWYDSKNRIVFIRIGPVLQNQEVKISLKDVRSTI